MTHSITVDKAAQADGNRVLATTLSDGRDTLPLIVVLSAEAIANRRAVYGLATDDEAVEASSP